MGEKVRKGKGVGVGEKLDDSIELGKMEEVLLGNQNIKPNVSSKM